MNEYIYTFIRISIFLHSILHKRTQIACHFAKVFVAVFFIALQLPYLWRGRFFGGWQVDSVRYSSVQFSTIQFSWCCRCRFHRCCFCCCYCFCERTVNVQRKVTGWHCTSWCRDIRAAAHWAWAWQTLKCASSLSRLILSSTRCAT